MIKILHITPHMGGGVGSLISKIILNSENILDNKIIIQEKPVNTNFIDSIEDKSRVIQSPGHCRIKTEIEWCDLVIIHWWHHPKTSEFIYNFPKTKTRVVFWSHISNLTTPAMNMAMIKEANRTLFTTEASYESKLYSSEDKEILLKKTNVVYGCGGLEKFETMDIRKPIGFNIGYLGLIDFSKMHPDFMDFCEAIKLKESKFIFAGDGEAVDFIKKEKIKRKIKNEFIFLGYINNIEEILSQTHIFGYPLANYHTCTTENSILEAMALEVVPVVMNQLSEKYIIENGKTGFLVSNKDEYGDVIRYLYKNPDIRRNIGENARKYVMKKFTSENILGRLYKACEEVVTEPKKIFNFKSVMGNTYSEWFLSGIGCDSRYFLNNKEYNIKDCSPLLKMSNKGSIFHYEREFNDEKICMWADMIRKK
ncbi:glycosyl transferase family 1 [Clostridioides difficile]|nr:glycosyl transferase family 1 [Clostridioides difficile]